MCGRFSKSGGPKGRSGHVVRWLRPALSEIGSLLASDKDFLRPIVRAVLQEVLEGEMTETLGAAKGERLSGRSEYYAHSLVTRIGNIELRVPQDRSVNANNSYGQVNTSGFRSSTPISEADPATPLAPTPEPLETILPSVFPHTLRECVLGH